MTLKLVVTATLIGMLLGITSFPKKPICALKPQENLSICGPKEAGTPDSQSSQTTNYFVQAIICNNNYKIQSIN